jgi:hypothetical protein
MKALINPEQNNFVVEVASKEFEVALPLYWVDCDSSVVAYKFCYVDDKFVEYIAPQNTSEQNKQIAVSLLQQTDWTSIPDVSNPDLSNPYLMNQTEFLSWRSKIRAIAVNPQEGNIDFPIMPNEKWSS